MKVLDRVEGTTTEAYQFDGFDEGGQLVQRLKSSESVPEGVDVVVGSFRLYLPQKTTLPDATTGVDFEIVERDQWLVWNMDEQRWEIYPPKLFDKYFEIKEQ